MTEEASDEPLPPPATIAVEQMESEKQSPRVRRPRRKAKRILLRYIRKLKTDMDNFEIQRRRAHQQYMIRQQLLGRCVSEMLLDSEMQLINHASQLGSALEAEDDLTNAEFFTNCQRPGETVRFFEDIVADFTDEQWSKTFHITEKTFKYLLNRMANEPIDIGMPLDAVVAMSIYAMATGMKFSGVGLMFQKPDTFVRLTLYNFVQALLRRFENEQLDMPKSRKRLASVCGAFSKISHLPPCMVGVLSVFELPIFSFTQPGSKSYGMDRVIVQSVIDDQLLFRKIEVDHKSPSMLLRGPNVLTIIPPRNFNGAKFSHFVLAPQFYPLRSWLMKKYKHPMEQHEHDFNDSLDRLQTFGNNALQRLFGRWQILSSTEFIEPESKSLIAKACCILHNITQRYGDTYLDEWNEDIDLDKFKYALHPEPTYKYSTIAHAKRDTMAKLIKPLREAGFMQDDTATESQ